MQRTEQMVVVGELAAGLAHESRTHGRDQVRDERPLRRGVHLARGQAVLQKVVAEITQLGRIDEELPQLRQAPEAALEPVNVNQMLNTTLTSHLKHQVVEAGGSGKIEIVKEFASFPRRWRIPPSCSGSS